VVLADRAATSGHTGKFAMLKSSRARAIRGAGNESTLQEMKFRLCVAAAPNLLLRSMIGVIRRSSIRAWIVSVNYVRIEGKEFVKSR
jgi:hypothetical protein